MKMLTNYGTYIYFHFIKVANATAEGINIEEIRKHNEAIQKDREAFDQKGEEAHQARKQQQKQEIANCGSDRKKIKALKRAWAKEVRELGIQPINIK